MNNCQDGHCFCGDDFGGCIETADTCHQVSNDKYEAVCGCGEKKTPCKEHQFCNKENVYQILLIHLQLRFSQKSPQKVYFLLHLYDISTNNYKRHFGIFMILTPSCQFRDQPNGSTFKIGRRSMWIVCCSIKEQPLW